jgi:hypothetical protein
MFGGTSPCALSPSNSDLVVFASPRYAIFQSFIMDDPGPWQGVVEHEREAPEDTAVAGYPCWSYINSLSFMGSPTTQATNNSTFRKIAFPRTRNGTTGASASASGVLRTATAWDSSITNYTLDFTISSSELDYGYGWDTNKKIIHTISPGHRSSQTTNYGRMFGIKAVAPIGDLMNKVAVKVDANKFYSSSGSDADHWVLPLTGVNHSANLTEAQTGGNFQKTVVSFSAPNNINSVVFSGKAYYCTTDSSSVRKIDASSLATTTVNATRAANHGVFDGGQYIYYGCNGYLVRIDVSNDSVTEVAANGAANLAGPIAIDGEYIYCALVTLAASPTIQVFSRSSFTYVRTLTANYSAASTTTISGMAPDYEGSLFAIQPARLTTVADARIYKFDSDTGSVTNAAGAAYANTLSCGLSYDPVRQMVIWAAGVAATVYAGEFSSTASLSALSVLTSQSRTVGNNGYYSASIVPLQGRYHVQMSSGTSAGWSLYSSVSTAISVNNSITVNSVYMTSAGYGIWSDGNRIFAVDSSNNYFMIYHSMHNKRHRNAATTNAQVLLPV